MKYTGGVSSVNPCVKASKSFLTLKVPTLLFSHSQLTSTLFVVEDVRWLIFFIAGHLLIAGH